MEKISLQKRSYTSVTGRVRLNFPYDTISSGSHPTQAKNRRLGQAVSDPTIAADRAVYIGGEILYSTSTSLPRIHFAKMQSLF